MPVIYTLMYNTIYIFFQSGPSGILLLGSFICMSNGASWKDYLHGSKVAV
uniref:Uncharacterized protein n=1 Tax=Anguilla anguilla TaxID=7936 RepID=A0A0E9UIA7_ANGAN